MSSTNDTKVDGSIFLKKKELVLTPHASGSSLSERIVVPGRNIYSSFRRRLGSQFLPSHARVTVGVPTSTASVQVGQMVTGGMSYILCKLANNSPLAHHTRDKLGCCIISYRNIITFFSRQFPGNFFSNLKPSLNRGTPTLFLNLYLTYLNAIFVSFCYPEGDKKYVKMGGAK